MGNCMACSKTVSFLSFFSFCPFIIPHLYLALFSFPGTLFASVPPRFLACSLSYPSVSIHQDRIRFSALLTPFHIGLHNVIKQGRGGMISASSFLFHLLCVCLISQGWICAVLHLSRDYDVFLCHVLIATHLFATQDTWSDSTRTHFYVYLCNLCRDTHEGDRLIVSVHDSTSHLFIYIFIQICVMPYVHQHNSQAKENYKRKNLIVVSSINDHVSYREF